MLRQSADLITQGGHMAFSPDELGRRAAGLIAQQAAGLERRKLDEVKKAEETREYLRSFVEYVGSLGTTPLPIFLRGLANDIPTTDGWLWQHRYNRYPHVEYKYETFQPIGFGHLLTYKYEYDDEGSACRYVGQCVSVDLDVYPGAPCKLDLMAPGSRPVHQLGYYVMLLTVHGSPAFIEQQTLILASMRDTIEQTVIEAAAAYRRGNLPLGLGST